MAMPKWRNVAALRNRAYQHLAELCYVDDDRRLAKHRAALKALDPLHVKFLALPAIKSGGDRTLRMLGPSIWKDAKFLADMIVYARMVENTLAVIYLEGVEWRAKQERDATTTK